VAALEFRRATIDDVPKIVALLADDELGKAREDAGPSENPRYREAFDSIDEDPNQLLAVVEESGEVIGCLQITFIPGLSRIGSWRGQIESVRIASTRRGSGIGRLMFKWAFDECRKRGCALIQLTTDKSRADALRFYESLGFEASHNGLKRPL